VSTQADVAIALPIPLNLLAGLVRRGYHAALCGVRPHELDRLHTIEAAAIALRDSALEYRFGMKGKEGAEKIWQHTGRLFSLLRPNRSAETNAALLEAVKIAREHEDAR
jgi:hypothetical protein